MMNYPYVLILSLTLLQACQPIKNASQQTQYMNHPLNQNKIISSRPSVLDRVQQRWKQGEALPNVLEADEHTSFSEIFRTKEIFQDSFRESHWQKNWTLEGPGQVKIENNTLFLQPILADKFIQRYQQGEFVWIPENMKPYFKVLEEVALESELKDHILDYHEKGSFKGGHIVLWNRYKTPENYIVEFDLKIESPLGLFILFFSSDGLNGQDLFSPQQKSRNGIFSQYVRGDISSYHISSYTPHRGTANVRKNPGAHLISSHQDLHSLSPDQIIRYRLIKYGNRFQYYLNQQLQVDHIDLGDHAPALEGGYVGLRLMASAKAQFKNFKLLELKENPFTPK